ncbi:MAG: hypothetical protein MJZ81_01130 [Bacteroidales bacterium]|nr:hypothetical protein [Bacteroidales bacterium]
MARTIAEIKQQMTDAWMAEGAVRERYGLSSSDTFEGKFSKVSIEGLLFYVVAFGIWVLENLMDTHKAEVETMLAERLPHTTLWYRNLVLGFVPDTEDEAPVKYCSVDDRGSRLKIKIAGGGAGARQPVTAEAQAAEEAYLAQEKDAGLKITVINEQSDRMAAKLRVWYDPIKLVPSSKAVEAALKGYVSSLDFDGLMSRNGLVDALREVEGVEMVKIEQLKTKYAGNPWTDFGEQQRAESGYWTVADADVTVVYERYRKENL